MDFLQGLNTKQLEAVQSTDGPVIINAGPGTGKTKTLITRILYLIEKKRVLPSQILALTFTHKAATELKERLIKYIDPNSLPPIHTFHSFCHELLLSTGIQITIISDQEREEIFEILKKKYKYSKKDLSLLISRYKNGEIDNNIAEIVSDYNVFLQKNNNIDFDDLLLNTHHLLQTNSDIKKRLQQRFNYIHVDEFQDTNTIQYEILKLLLNKNNNIFVIGDINQSIYAFRGAKPKIMLDMSQDFSSCKKITLTLNYRSSSIINKVSASLFSMHPLESFDSSLGKVAIVKTQNEYSESDWIINKINKVIGGTDLLQAGTMDYFSDKKSCFKDFAIIYRTHTLKNAIELTFMNAAIPYQTIGEDSLFRQREVYFIILCLKYIESKKKNILSEILQSSLLQSVHTKQALKHILDQNNLSLNELVNEIISATQLQSELNEKKDKLRNLNHFISIIYQFTKDKRGLQKCLEYIKYLEEHEYYDPIGDKVTLLTMHAAKGLEFTYVFVCGFEEGIIPLKREDSDIEEEKRLLYVGMTRAKRELYLLYTNERRKKPTTISSFYSYLKSDELNEIEDEAIEKLAQKRSEYKEKKRQMKLF